jgi:hypothetical protein
MFFTLGTLASESYLLAVTSRKRINSFRLTASLANKYFSSANLDAPSDLFLAAVSSTELNSAVSWKSRVLGFGHAELDIGDADRAEYR